MKPKENTQYSNYPIFIDVKFIFISPTNGFSSESSLRKSALCLGPMM